MPHFDNYIIDQLLLPSLTLFFFVGGVFAVAVGVGLIASSGMVLRLFGPMNYTVSTRQSFKQMAATRDSGTFVWKYRRLIGAIFVVGAAYSIYGLIARVDSSAVVTMFNLKLPMPFVLSLVDAARLFLIAACTVSIAVGILLGFFPDAMRAIEKQSSHWYSTRQLAPGAETMNLAFDNWVAAFPRTAGWIIVFPAIGIVVYFGSQLLGRI
jgi:hypothetical protein